MIHDEVIPLQELTFMYQLFWWLYTILSRDVNSCMQEGIFTIRDQMDKGLTSKTSAN